MSFIFARTDGRNGTFFSDSLLTRIDETSDAADLNQHALKIHVFGKDHCIALSGLFGPCVHTIVAFSKLPSEVRNQADSHLILGELLQKQCSEFDHRVSDCELLYMRRRKDKIELYVIQNGLPKPVSQGFIGDTSFYEEFVNQLAATPYFKIQGDESLSEFSKEDSRICQALLKIDPNISRSVAPVESFHWIRVATDENHGFVFLASARSGSNCGSGGMTSLFYISNPAHGVAVYIQAERRGFMFYSGLDDYPIEVQGASFEDFQLNVLTKGKEILQGQE